MKKPVQSDSFFEGRMKFIVPVVIILVVLVSAYFLFFHVKRCSDEICFDNALAKCSKASFLNIKEDSRWEYLIKGSSSGKCLVYVKNEFIAIDEVKELQGKSMVCSLLKGVVMQPESDLSQCHGLLKESLQDIIIERLHIYIVQNIGQINEELEKPLI